MNEQLFDTITRRAAGMVSRRASLLTLGAAGLALAGPISADAKNNNNDKCKKDKKACQNDLADCTAQAELCAGQEDQCATDLAECTAQAAQCAAQVEQCNIFLRGACAGEPNCLDSAKCCSLLEGCEFGRFFACLFDTSDV